MKLAVEILCVLWVISPLTGIAIGKLIKAGRGSWQDGDEL